MEVRALSLAVGVGGDDEGGDEGGGGEEDFMVKQLEKRGWQKKSGWHLGPNNILKKNLSLEVAKTLEKVY